MEKKAIGKHFDPGRYGMVYCPLCKGLGKLFNGIGEGVVCKICGGFGLIRSQKENNFGDHRAQSKLN